MEYSEAGSITGWDGYHDHSIQVYQCGGCAALVTWEGQDTHSKFHAKIEEAIKNPIKLIGIDPYSAHRQAFPPRG